MYLMSASWGRLMCKLQYQLQRLCYDARNVTCSNSHMAGVNKYVPTHFFNDTETIAYVLCQCVSDMTV
jgi:hypothetical protein